MKSIELKEDLQNIEKYQEERKQEYDDSLYVCVYLTLVRCESFRRRKGKKGVARRERKEAKQPTGGPYLDSVSKRSIARKHF